MDLTQRKLTKKEWEGIEIPLPKEEIDVLKLIIQGFDDVNYKTNSTLTLISYLKIENNEVMQCYLYELYLKNKIDQICKKNNHTFTPKTNKAKKIKKADKIRIENSTQKITENQENIYEFVFLNICSSLLKYYTRPSDKWMYYLYALNKLNSYSVLNVNTHLKEFVQMILDTYIPKMEIEKLIEHGSEFIEKNSYILKYDDRSLYDHQKNIFSIFKSTISQNTPKLVLYTAPTGTGKTLTPIGLSNQFRVLFVCAARHVGLALARAGVSIEKKVAFAFGCKDAGDIRLHYHAVKECIRNKKTGGIRKVDNSRGENVEILISDIQSFQSAMYYMLAFNKPEDIIVYWDEPTITMDYETHEYHELIHENWKINTIPNLVLSTATLPSEEELRDVIADFKSKHDNAESYNIRSHDTKKSITMINKNGHPMVPHLCFSDVNELKQSVNHLLKNKTLLRYLDMKEVCEFIIYMQEDKLISRQFKLAQGYFTHINEITLTSLKEYYLILLKNVYKKYWTIIYDSFKTKKGTTAVSNIQITTKDAHTLTDGPTMFLTANAEKIATFYLQQSNIPEGVSSSLLGAIEHNRKVSAMIDKKEKDYEDGTKKDEGHDRKLSDQRVNPNMRTLLKEISALRCQLKEVRMNDLFIPNRKEHLEKWASQYNIKNTSKFSSAFTCDIDEKVVEQIMELRDVDNTWKMLLLMGIGVFTRHVNPDYVEIMKTLADEKKLFLIVATTDYIYGTNYQFCHAYISKDLANMTQEKSIQALGRVGRKNIQQNYTIRFRDDGIIRKILLPEENKPEVKNMCELFNSD